MEVNQLNTRHTQTFSAHLTRIERWGEAHSAGFYTAPLLAWALLIALGSLAPPEELPQITFPFADKVEHFFIYSVLGALLLRGWIRGSRPAFAAALAAIAISAFYGFYLEVLQSLTPYRTFDWMDELGNALGAALGVAVWFWLTRRRAPERSMSA